VELVDELKGQVPPGIALADYALRWILDHEAVTVVIPGARNPQQARDNTKASALAPLGDEAHRALANFYTQKVASQIRGPN